MLTVVFWKWAQPGYHTRFTAQHVNILADAIDRHLRQPHEIVLVADDWREVDKRIRPVDLWEGGDEAVNLRGPRCFRRLRAFAPDAASFLGERILSIDLDMAIVGPLDPLVDRDEDFVIWRGAAPAWRGARVNPYNGSMWLLRAGTRPQAWLDYDPARSPAMLRAAGFFGTDQAWLAYRLPGEATWGREDGVLSYRLDLENGCEPLPRSARVVSFHGQASPWDADCQTLSWVRDACPLS